MGGGTREIAKGGGGRDGGGGRGTEAERDRERGGEVMRVEKLMTWDCIGSPTGPFRPRLSEGGTCRKTATQQQSEKGGAEVV